MIHGLARVNDWIRQHALMAIGVEKATPADLDRHARMMRSTTVERLRTARLRLGALRYGPQGKGQVSYAHALRNVLEYAADGNREHLIDAINSLEIEWLYPSREGTHFAAVDRAEPTPAIPEGGLPHWCAGCRRACDSDECPRCGSVLP